MKTVLAPIDFSPVSQRIVAEAVTLARAMGARLVVLHVVTPPPVIGEAMTLRLCGAEFTAAAEKEAARQLTELQRSLRDRGITAQVVRASGDARTCILEQAETLPADHIVIGAPSRVAPGGPHLGGTTSGILRGASCRIVVVPSGTKHGAGGGSLRARAERSRCAAA